MRRSFNTVLAVLTLCLALSVSPAFAQSAVRFAIIGDYGLAGPGAEAVAEMVTGWEPDFILTTGDNNYPRGSAATIDDNVGQYYHAYIAPYYGDYGSGAEVNRFFPTLGNHDWQTAGAKPYFDYFTLPGNERYYEFVWGPVHFFALNTDPNEPDGIHSESQQAAWLQERLAASTAQWQIVYMHVPPFSSGAHGPHPYMQWPFGQWGASAVISGHDHHYERLLVDGLPYFVNGAGGAALYALDEPMFGSEERFNRNFGAMLVTAEAEQLTFEFYSVAEGGTLIDSYTLSR